MMKMKYEKPGVAVENFQLSQHIATCAIKIGFQSYLCVLADADSTEEMKDLAWEFEFLNGDVCDKWTTGGTSDDGLCYHTNAGGAFTS